MSTAQLTALAIPPQNFSSCLVYPDPLPPRPPRRPRASPRAARPLPLPARPPAARPRAWVCAGRFALSFSADSCSPAASHGRHLLHHRGACVCAVVLCAVVQPLSRALFRAGSHRLHHVSLPSPRWHRPEISYYYPTPMSSSNMINR